MAGHTNGCSCLNYCKNYEPKPKLPEWPMSETIAKYIEGKITGNTHLLETATERLEELGITWGVAPIGRRDLYTAAERLSLRVRCFPQDGRP